MGILKKMIRGWRGSLLWFVVNCFICYFPSRHIRRFTLRVLGMKIGKTVSMFQGFHIREPKKITIGDGCSIGPKVLLDGRRGLTLGKNVTVAYEAIIWTLNHDYNDVGFAGKGDEVTIGDYAWICSRAIILPGVKIGKCAVIASGAIVTKDVGDYEIWGGIPAKLIGHREKNDYKYTPGLSALHLV